MQIDRPKTTLFLSFLLFMILAGTVVHEVSHYAFGLLIGGSPQFVTADAESIVPYPMVYVSNVMPLQMMLFSLSGSTGTIAAYFLLQRYIIDDVVKKNGVQGLIVIESIYLSYEGYQGYLLTSSYIPLKSFLILGTTVIFMIVVVSLGAFKILDDRHTIKRRFIYYG
ncbi:MAG: hypothetical protein V5A88_07325 [Candidatus Thermoplasmatota archaeon]